MSEPIIRTFTIPSWGTITTTTYPGRAVVNAIHECITRTGDGKNHYWELDTDSLSGTGIRSENGLVTGIVLKNIYTDFNGISKSQKLSIRSAGSFLGGGNVTYTNISVACALHPDGESTIINSLPTTSGLVSSTTSFSGAQSSFSGESSITGGYYDVANSSDGSLRYYNLTSTRIADGQSITGWIIELPDAITIALKASTTANWYYGMHAGKILIPTDYSDYDNFIDGSGILTGGPSFYNSTGEGHRWWFRSEGDTQIWANNNVSASKIRVGESNWMVPYIVNSGIQNTASNNINNNPRLVPYEIRAGLRGRQPNNTETYVDGLIGTTKYLRKGPSTAINTVIDSPNASNNISWLNQYSTTTSTLMFHIWKRDVSPTTAQ